VIEKRPRGRPRINPRTPEEWQEAVDAAHLGLLIDSGFQYGLLQGENGSKESGIKVDRCLRVLKLGKRKGFEPRGLNA